MVLQAYFESTLDWFQNKWIHEKVGSLLDTKSSYCWKKAGILWTHHETSMLGNNTVEGMVDGKRRRGRPAPGWVDDIKEWTGLTITNDDRLANDRKRWKALIRTTPALVGAMWLERERFYKIKIACLCKVQMKHFPKLFHNWLNKWTNISWYQLPVKSHQFWSHSM